ncbi:MAG: hypothetical protein ABIR58_09095 [Gemmatimonadaceae bacterium]
MGWTALAGADTEAAQHAFVRAVREYEVVGIPRGTGVALMGLAAVEAAVGRPERAVAIAAAADALSARAGVVVEHPMRAAILRLGIHADYRPEAKNTTESTLPMQLGTRNTGCSHPDPEFRSRATGRRWR